MNLYLVAEAKINLVSSYPQLRCGFKPRFSWPLATTVFPTERSRDIFLNVLCQLNLQIRLKVAPTGWESFLVCQFWSKCRGKCKGKGKSKSCSIATWILFYYPSLVRHHPFFQIDSFKSLSLCPARHRMMTVLYWSFSWTKTRICPIVINIGSHLGSTAG